MYNTPSRRDLLRSAAYVLALQRLSARQQAPTFSTEVKVVNVFATVHDKDGKIVPGLTKDDFTLLEDGRPQVIRYFAQQSDLPLTLGVLVDTSRSEQRMIPTEREASSTFFEKVLRPDRDKAFLIHFDRDVELLQDLTSSRERLEKALALLQNSSSNRENGDNDPGQHGGGDSGGGGWHRHGGGERTHGGGTALYDAIYLASDELMKKQAGRKALVMLTDGDDRGSKITLADAISSAQRADTLAYSVRIADEEQPFNRGYGDRGMGRHRGGGWPGGGGNGPSGRSASHGDGKNVLQRISKETGGAYFEVSKKKPVDEIYRRIEEDLRNQYSIGYTSDRQESDSGYRKITVTVAKKGLTVQARDGYYPATS